MEKNSCRYAHALTLLSYLGRVSFVLLKLFRFHLDLFCQHWNCALWSWKPVTGCKISKSVLDPWQSFQTLQRILAQLDRRGLSMRSPLFVACLADLRSGIDHFFRIARKFLAFPLCDERQTGLVIGWGSNVQDFYSLKCFSASKIVVSALAGTLIAKVILQRPIQWEENAEPKQRGAVEMNLLNIEC